MDKVIPRSDNVIRRANLRRAPVNVNAAALRVAAMQPERWQRRAECDWQFPRARLAR